jgi:CHASE3 domain sensor protein
VSAVDGEKAIADFTESLHDEDRARLITLAFAGLLEQTNHQRQFLIERIEDLGERQHKLANLIAQIIAELDAIPPDAKGDAAAQRADLEQRRAFTTRSFESVQRTMRYACEAPVQLDARLGAYARMLAQALEISPPPHRQ